MTDIDKRLERIEKKLSLLISKERKATWVKVGFITDVTGWDGEKLRQAREQGLVKFKKTEQGWFYLLESLPDVFIKKTA